MSGRSDDPRFASVAELRQAWAEAGSASEALVASCLAAMEADERHSRPLSAVRWINPTALDEAGATDRDAAGARGPLSGVPVVLKDNIDMIDAPTTSGARALSAAMPWRNAGVVDRLREAGAVILAKTNLSEFSFEIRSRSSLGGDVLNPFDRDVTAGGSSGGAAAAVAAGFATAALGTDTGGSIRTPAAFNGLVGLRPTHGLIDRSGVAPLAPSTDTVGTLTRSVADAALVFACLTGDRAAVSGQGLDGDLRTIRVGAFRQAFGVDPAIVATTQSALDRLADLGATVVDPVGLPDEAITFDGDHIVDWEFRPAFDRYLATNFSSGAPASVAAILKSGEFLADYRETLSRRVGLGDLNNAIYRSILAAHRTLARAVSELFQSHRLDALIYPTSMVVPTSLDNPKGGWAPELAARTGRPAITLPVGLAASGVPIGVELLGERRQEAALLGMAAALERSLGARFRPRTT